MLLLLLPFPASGQSADPACPAATATVVLEAEGNAFTAECIAVPADTAFKVTLKNNDPFAHNFSIYRSKGGDEIFIGAYASGNKTLTYDIGAQAAGRYYFVCDIHPIMDGPLLVGDGAQASPTATRDTTRAPAGPVVRLEEVAGGFVAPVFVTGAGDGSDRLFVVDQSGVIKIITDGAVAEKPFLDIAGKLVKQNPDYDERGLLGLAFHPKYKDNGRFFVWYSAPLRSGAPAGWDHTIHLSEFKASSDPAAADPASERIVLRIDKPQRNHNSGHIAFGPDGLLYAPIGDGGAGNDVGLGHPPGGNGQDLTTILGNILRIDVDGKAPYAIPEDNPYADRANGALPEIFASGFRNPYHISFDDERLFVADAGQDRYEEVSLVTAGGNYGWRIKEGTHCFSVETPSKAPSTCPSVGPRGEPLIDPIIEYNHAQILGSVIIGGYVYRGSSMPALRGAYIFGDYSRDRLKPDGTLFVAKPADEGLWPIQELQVRIDDDPDPGPSFGRFVLAFGQGDDRELYVTMSGRGGPEGQTGTVYRFAGVQGDPAGAARSDGPPAWLFVAIGIVLAAAVLAFVARKRSASPTADTR